MVLYAGIVRDGRDHMFFTMDEVALIDGLIATYFVADSVSESVRIRYDIIKRINTSKTTEPIMRI